MYEFRSPRRALFTIISVGITLLTVSILNSVYSQSPGTFSVSSMVLGKDKPVSMAIDEKTNKIYGIFATSSGEKNLIYVIDTAQNKLSDTIKIGSQKGHWQAYLLTLLPIQYTLDHYILREENRAYM